jgi:hypothetical protein
MILADRREIPNIFNPMSKAPLDTRKYNAKQEFASHTKLDLAMMARE